MVSSATLGFLAWALLTQRQVAGQSTCERLKRSLTYTQEEAPRDLSGVLPVVVGRVNQVLEGVVNVEVGYHGDDLQGRVGEHLVKCEVTRLASVLPDDLKTQAHVDDMGRNVVTQCFEVPFTILDTNECKLPLHHPLRHQCQAPSICVNTNGSYDCVCPRIESSGTYPSDTVDDEFWVKLQAEERTPWELAYNSSSRTSCPSSPSTHGCCSERTNSKDAMACRSNFHCPKDPCKGANDCASSSTCVRESSPNARKTYSCRCPEGLMGNGQSCRPGIDPKPQPKVRFDGVTPTEETIKNNYYCDCTAPVVDACCGFPPCKGKHEVCIVTAANVPQCGCKPGYVMHETYGCVDESPPVMKLRHDLNGDQTLRLKQGDVYEEYAVDIQDENAEEYMRSLKIAYSRPLPHGCLTKVGEFHVNYTIATPWTTPAFLRLTRRVIIEDIDECKLDVAKFETECPPLVPKCNTEAGATCVNKIGTYTCQCPKYTSGDGFLSGLSFDAEVAVVPHGFKGGTGCHDTSKPVIELKGPNPKVFRISKCGALGGVMSSKQMDHDADLKSAQQKYYSDDIKLMIRQTVGAELCATHELSRPNASHCVKAFDETFKGKVDLSREVSVGDPTQTSMLQWRVPYDVEDAAGNKAETVWRDVVVEEVDLADVEARVRSESLLQKNAEIRRAVEQALAEERRKGGSRRNQRTAECPKCPACTCPGDGSGSSSFDPSLCDPVCGARDQTCTAVEFSSAMHLVIWLEGLMPPLLVTALLIVCVLYFMFIIIRMFWSFQATPRNSYTPAYNAEEREQGLKNHIREFSPEPQPQNGGFAQPHNGGFTPHSMIMARSPAPSGQRPPRSGGPPVASASIYGDVGQPFSPSPRFGDPSPRFGDPSPRFGDQAGRSAESSFFPQESVGNGIVDIYQRSPIITPRKRGNAQRSPYGRH